ncbi:MAG: hypothetical protein U5L04_05835 [Trueperaceae bacterium]|nr:hypothetical protein [Trueperaceae bacterium]
MKRLLLSLFVLAFGYGFAQTATFLGTLDRFCTLTTEDAEGNLAYAAAASPPNFTFGTGDPGVTATARSLSTIVASIDAVDYELNCNTGTTGVAVNIAAPTVVNAAPSNGGTALATGDFDFTAYIRAQAPGVVTTLNGFLSTDTDVEDSGTFPYTVAASTLNTPLDANDTVNSNLQFGLQAATANGASIPAGGYEFQYTFTITVP